MVQTATLDVQDGDLLLTLREFFKSVLSLEDISAILVPQTLPMKPVVMPTLVADVERLDRADPLAPMFPMNAAKVLSRLTRRMIGQPIAAVLRACELRAFVELVKLHQGRMEEVTLIGVDCLGAYSKAEFLRRAGDGVDAVTQRFYREALGSDAASPLSPACDVCESPIPTGADLLIGLYGVDVQRRLIVEARSEKGQALVDRLELSGAEVPPQRQPAIDTLVKARSTRRDAMFAETRQATRTLAKLTAYLSSCVNCYNCRVACPVCYCKECVFVTDVFDHEPAQYLRWAHRKGAVKMPTDTVFYHLTRLAHMSTACVGCGQCSNACPNDIPVMELFRTVAHDTQRAFAYEAGRSVDEKPPLSEFREEEFEQIVGIDKAS
jgi:formate dehydrogenase subunit beta